MHTEKWFSFWVISGQ